MTTKQEAYQAIEKRARERYPDDTPQQAVARLMEGPDGRTLAAAYERAEPGGLIVEKAEEVGSIPGQAEADVLDHMAELVARRLGMSKARAYELIASTREGQEEIAKYRGARNEPAELPVSKVPSSDEIIEKALLGEITDREAIARMIDDGAEQIAKRKGISKAEAYERMESNPRFGRLVEDYYATA